MIQFKRIIVHNFGSYGHAELDLQNRGFCLVSGQNNYIKDNAVSNGSGKSFIFSAICYAITGETISGIRSNLKNINVDEQDCWVQLDFLYNKDLFSLTRVVAPKSDLKILKNDIDLSGKGIRESEKRLQEILPDLTKDLVTSTITLGQGMPHKFSSFSPSGRKELLEKLTKSDFMIDDLKTRIQSRQQELSSKLREFEDSLLANNTQLNGYLTTLNKINENIKKQSAKNFDELLKDASYKINALQQEHDRLLDEIKVKEAEVEDAHERLLKISEEKAAVSEEELNAYTISHSKLYNEKVKLEFTISSLETEINKILAIKDTCPTCGQRLPNVNKPSTEQQELQLANVKFELQVLQESISECNAKHQKYVLQITEAFKDEINLLNKTITNIKQTINSLQKSYGSISYEIDTERTNYNRLLYEKQNWEAFLMNQNSEVAKLEIEIARLTNIIAISGIAKEECVSRLAIVKKMDQLTKRDFRGYLLTNIIEYIDNKAKDYCSIVFGTRELHLCLNGNALDITYCSKAFDGLSGGEKQRVDLIIQLAIRDLLTSYFGLDSNILVLDEITDFLDKQSCQAVMNLLEKELQTVESVFIISHRASMLDIQIDSEIKIVKNTSGISELY